MASRLLTLAQVMACFLTAPSHYLNQCCSATSHFINHMLTYRQLDHQWFLFRKWNNVHSRKCFWKRRLQKKSAIIFRLQHVQPSFNWSWIDCLVLTPVLCTRNRRPSVPRRCPAWRRSIYWRCVRLDRPYRQSAPTTRMWVPTPNLEILENKQ